MPESFIFKRWSTASRSYVDSQNKTLAVIPSPRPDPSFVSVPPEDGSCPYLMLPTELRLEIYSYLAPLPEEDESEYFKIIRLPRNEYPQPGRTRYAYFYRSPGRVTRPAHISAELLKLLRVCHQMREEVMDAVFRRSNDTFVLEASLYRDTAGGLQVLPVEKLFPSAWVKRLLILTVVEVDGSSKGITDLRPLQQMTTLEEVRILSATKCRPSPKQSGKLYSSPARRVDDPIAAIIECVPPSAKVHIGCDEALKKELKKSLGSGIEYVFESDETESMESRMLNMRCTLINGERQGRLSGSSVNHSRCSMAGCIEGLDCVNSRRTRSFELGSRGRM